MPVSLKRWGAATVTAGIVLISGAASASAADGRTTASATQQTRTTTASPLAGSYRGIQGANFCLLARCTVGDSGPGTGPSNTQGINFCLLALCTIRP
ncbi:hypothetical protein [Streptomyces corynorhini]|nr:hypothetical protein [Streptomyces corynorhini]